MTGNFKHHLKRACTPFIPRHHDSRTLAYVLRASVFGSRPDRRHAQAERGCPGIQLKALAPALRWQDRGQVVASRH
jgi:hypothetical protein